MIPLSKKHILKYNFLIFFTCTYQYSFIDKEYILISRRHQLHLTSATTQCPNDIPDAHNQKEEENYRKEKSRYSDLFLVVVVQTPP
jgi:hypothetical protein